MKNKQGFTLIEVLIALAILGVGLMAIMQLFPQALTQARRAAERTVTAQLGQSKLSRVRAAGASNLYAGSVDAELLNDTRDLRTRLRIDTIVEALFPSFPGHPLRLAPIVRIAIVNKISNQLTNPDPTVNIPAIQDMLKEQELFIGFNATTQRLAGAAKVYLQRTTFTVEFADNRSETFVIYTAKQ